jgi:hypothetical protein
MACTFVDGARSITGPGMAIGTRCRRVPFRTPDTASHDQKGSEPVEVRVSPKNRITGAPGAADQASSRASSRANAELRQEAKAGAGALNYRLIILALLVLFALIAGLLGGALSALAGVHAALAVMAGAGSFGSTMLLGVAVWQVMK